MTVDSGHEPTEWESAPRPNSQNTPPTQHIHYSTARHGSHVEESPELLRWRADLLMDEMMMGGVDVSAADGNRTFSGVDSPVIQRPRSSTNGGSNGGGSNGGSYASDHGRSPRDSYERNPYEHGNRSHGGNDSSSKGNPINRDQNQDHFSPTDTTGDKNRAPYPSPSTRNDFSNQPRDFDAYTKDTQGRYTSDSVSSDPRSVGANRAPYPDIGNSHPSDEPLRQPQARPTPSASPTSGTYTNQRYDSGGYENGTDRYGFDNESAGRGGSLSQPSEPNQPPLHSPEARQYSEQKLDQSTSDSAQHVQREHVQREDEQRFRHPNVDEPPPMQSRLRTTMDDAPAASSDQNLRTDRAYPTDQQDEPFRREPNHPSPALDSTPPQRVTRPPLEPVELPTRKPAPTPRVKPQPVDEHTQWATVADKWEYQDFASNPEVEEEEEESPFLSAYSAPERRPTQDSAVRNDPAQFVSAMSVMGSNKKRSTLLPRSSTLDVDTLHREISDLHGEIAALLPVGNETGERARHLLDKAYSILQSDPMRSAEVEYYMQQVRTIVQRLYQARKWSDLYRQRLHVYLWGWLGLSAVILIARFIFQLEIEEGTMWLFGIGAEHLFVTHWATFIGTVSAGALGGAIGALYTMQTHARGEHSFFDRKYGLRGLILPFMGLIVGALGYLFFGLVFALVGIDPSQSLTAAIVPTMAAFAFGFSQESIYGTRG